MESLSKQSAQPFEIIVVDASVDDETRKVCEAAVNELSLRVRWLKAVERGAAAQRNQGIEQATQPFIWFFDDDILFEENCVQRLWHTIGSDAGLGGVNAMIVNQRYETPGAVSRAVFRVMNGRAERSYAGKLIGPAINLLPEDRDDLPSVIPVDWLNTTCTIYRREALPDPVFDRFFEGYSLMEDVALSLRVAQRGWRLSNARTARIRHDSETGEHKANIAAVSAMELRNRFYIMTSILGKRTFLDYVRLALWELFTLFSVIARGDQKRWPAEIKGKWRAMRELIVAR
jgi:glycosyltransferase involved in cell wall biosynthesis